MISLDTHVAEEKDLLHLEQRVLGPQEARFLGNSQDMSTILCMQCALDAV